MAIVEHFGKRYLTTKDGLQDMDGDYFKKENKMSKDRVGIETDNHLAKQDANAEALEEWEEITKHHFDAIEEQLFHIRNKAEAFADIDLEDEIKSRVGELL